jgi:hypothetical protein
MANLQPLPLKRGTSATLSITLPTELDPVDAIVFFTVKPGEVVESKYDNDNQAILKKIITEHTGRVFSVSIDPADTNDVTPGNYVYGITVKNAAGEILGTRADGQFIIEPRDTADVSGE